MAQINIVTTKEEQQKVLDVLRGLNGEVTPVSTIAKQAGMSAGRTRYAIMDLVDSEVVERVASKAFNKHYVRYSYKILKNNVL